MDVWKQVEVVGAGLALFPQDDVMIRGRRVTFNPDSLNFVRFKDFQEHVGSFTFRKRKFILKTLVFYRRRRNLPLTLIKRNFNLLVQLLCRNPNKSTVSPELVVSAV